EPWYQLPAEVDASHLNAALETNVGLACDRNDVTEFPTLEEGTLPSAEASRRQSPGDAALSFLLGQFKAGLPGKLFLLLLLFSLCLPLLMYSTQGQRLSDKILLQQSEMDFIPLRGVRDVSGVSEEHSELSHARGAVSPAAAESPSVPSDCVTLSQHPLPFRHVEPCNASCSGALSPQASFSGQLLVNKEANEDCKNYINEKALISQTSNSLADYTSVTANRLNQVEPSLAEQTCVMSVKEEHLVCDSRVPATGFELSEEEKGLLRHELSSKTSCTTVLTKNSEKSEGKVEKVKVGESESEACVRQLEKL
ncbi:Alstrom syndrome protein 1, partial [Eurypyga helias]